MIRRIHHRYMSTTPTVAVGVIIFNTKHHVIVGQSPKWNGKWVIPGGHLEYGETLVDCAKREIQEEMGIEISDVLFSHIQECIFPRDFAFSQKHFIFINMTAHMKDQQNIVLNNEFWRYTWISIPEALQTLHLNESTKFALHHALCI